MGNCVVHMVTFPGQDEDCPVCELVKDRQRLIDRALETEAENARLREACRFALNYFEHSWKEVDEHPASQYVDYVDELRAALSDTAEDWLERKKEGWLKEAKAQLESERGLVTIIATGTLEIIKEEARQEERERCISKIRALSHADVGSDTAWDFKAVAIAAIREGGDGSSSER